MIQELRTDVAIFSGKNLITKKKAVQNISSKVVPFLLVFIEEMDPLCIVRRAYVPLDMLDSQ